MFAAEYLRTYAACLLFAHFFLGGWEAPFEDTIPYISYVPHIVWVLLKLFMFIFFVWFRAALHRVRTDRILEFGWRWLLPLSLVNLAIAAALRLWVYDGINEEWPHLIPVLITSISLALFILLSIDEDPEALEAQTRPFSVQTVDVAGPGQQGVIPRHTTSMQRRTLKSARPAHVDYTQGVLRTPILCRWKFFRLTTAKPTTDKTQLWEKKNSLQDEFDRLRYEALAGKPSAADRETTDLFIGATRDRDVSLRAP